MEAKAQVIQLSQTPQASASTENLAAIAQTFTFLGLDLDAPDPQMVTAMRVMVGTYIARLADRLNIPVGASDHRLNVTLQALDYYETRQMAKQVMDALLALQQAGISEDELPFGVEVRRQLTRHTGDLLTERLDQTTLAGEVYATQLVLGDLLDFVAGIELLGVTCPGSTWPRQRWETSVIS